MTYRPFHIHGAERKSRWLITVDHASNFIPEEINGGDLGLAPSDMARHIAYDVGALGCSFSGSGPSVFAWALASDLPAVERAMAEAFRAAKCDANAYDAPIDSAGLRVESVE